MSSDRFAVIAMVLGIMSIPLSLCCMLGVPLGVAAIVVSVMAVKRIDAAPHLHHGAKLARAGFWCGIGGTTLTILYIGFNILLPFFMSR